MIKVGVTLAILIAATLWLPLWIQLVLYAVSLFYIPQRLWLLVPAVFADVYYAPTQALSISGLTTTAVVSVLLIIYWLITTKTRVRDVYGMATK